MKVRKFYMVAVDDLKPVTWKQLAEAPYTDELIYVVDAEGEDIFVCDVRVGEHPKSSECARDKRDTSVMVTRDLRDICHVDA
jgi:hypothetical protein